MELEVPVAMTKQETGSMDHFISCFQWEIGQIQDLPPHQGFPCEAELSISSR